jgi:hypothetical protein
VDRAVRSAATVRKASRIACRMARRCANVNNSCPDAILAKDRCRQAKFLRGLGKRIPRFRKARGGLFVISAPDAALRPFPRIA